MFQVELKYKDVLLQELQAQNQIQPQAETVHIKPHTISYAAPKARVINYVPEPQTAGLIKAAPQLTFSSEAQGMSTNTHTVAYTEDQTPITISKTHLLAYDAQGNPQTIAYPGMQPLTLAKGQTLSYIADGHTLPSTSHYADGSAVLAKDHTLTFTTGSTTSLGPNAHVISFVPEAALGRPHILEYATDDLSGKTTFNSAEGPITAKIENIFDDSLSEHIPETITGDIIVEDVALKFHSPAEQ